MKVTWKGLLAGAGAVSAALVLGATVLVSTVGAQPPAPPAQPGTPPNRVFGTVQLNGQPAAAGTAVVALVGTVNCGTAQVSATATFVIDVASAASMAGCGTDGATVAFTVGGARATQTTMWRQGAFTELNLTAQAATPTPTMAPAMPTRTASPMPTRTASPMPTMAPRTPSPAPPTVAPRTPSPAPAVVAPQRPAAAPAAAQRPAAPAALPRTGTGVQADTASSTGLALGGLALAVLALGATGLVAYRRSR